MKAEIPYFSKIEKGGQKGGQGKRYFELKLVTKFEIFDFEATFQSKIPPPLAPLLAPLFYFWKEWNLSFHWKKIKVIAILDQKLVQFEFLHP